MNILETFICSGQNSSNSLCQFWNDKSIPPQILHHYSLSWYITPLLILRSHFLLWMKGSHQSPNFENFKWFGKNLPNYSCHFFKPQVSFSSNFSSLFSVVYSSVLFSAKTLYTLFKRSPLKCKFLKLMSVWVKIHQIPSVNFETTSQFPFKFCIIFLCHDT